VKRQKDKSTTPRPVRLRIIGGKFRGRKLQYSGDLRTRPMKDRLREAIFNLMGPSIKKKHAIDLFAGTGALGLEAISRGSDSATLIEQHFPTAKIIAANADLLEVRERVEIATANVFIWHKRGPQLPEIPWAVFCSPPYDFYVERTDEMLELIGKLIEDAPAESLFLLEADGRFDFSLLPQADSWDVRTYSAATVGLFRKKA
jgi:16S rRNA (guanine966-N2)-methyltransferase